MNEWAHHCKKAGRNLLIPAGEVCDRCGMEPPDSAAPDPLPYASSIAFPARESAPGVAPSHGNTKHCEPPMGDTGIGGER